MIQYETTPIAHEGQSGKINIKTFQQKTHNSFPEGNIFIDHSIYP